MQDLLDLIKNVLGVFINLIPKEHGRIHPCEVPQVRSHGTTIFFHTGCNFSIFLSRQSLNLISYGLILSIHVLNQTYLFIHHSYKIDRSLVTQRNLFLLRILISLWRSLVVLGRSSNISNLLFNSSCGCPSSSNHL